jgi:hypothetical protein
MQASAARSAARSQEAAANRQIDLQERVYGETVDRFAPFAGAGNNALAAYMSELGLGEAPMIGGQQYQGIDLSPAAQFAMQQGFDGVQSSAAARGMLNSGAALEGLERTRFGLAAGDRDNQLNRLAGLTEMGMGAAGLQATAGANMAAGTSNALGNLGNVQAAGAIGRGNAFSGMLENLGGVYGYMNGQSTGQNQRQF